VGHKGVAMPVDPFVHEYRVIYGDTDAANVVYYGNYMRYFEIGRTEYLRAKGLTYRDMEDEGYILPVVEAYSRYKASAKYDDVILIKTALVELKAVSCRFHYRIERKEDQKLLVKGFTVHAVINRQGKLVQFPAWAHETMVQLVANV